jgi:hypothetical protein
MLRLRTARLPLIITSLVILIIAVLSILPLMLTPSIRDNPNGQLSSFLTTLSIFVSFIFLCMLFALNLSTPYKNQSIEITEDGIKTRFLRRVRSLRWDEIRVFATYETQETYKNSSTKLQIYEVANEQNVVRWSQQSASISFLSVQSNLGEKEDWNWLVGRVNAFVTEHTNLPLLNLGVDKQQHESDDTSSVSVVLAKNDPLVQNVQWKGNNGSVTLIFGICSSILVVVGLLGNLPWTAQYLSLLNGGFGYVVLAFGVLFLLLALFLFITTRNSQRYWKRIGQLRQAAFLEPERYTAHQQPVAHKELLQPASILIRLGRRSIIWSIIITFVVYFLINFSFHFFPDDYRSLVSLLISTALSSLVYGIGMGVLSFYAQRNTGKQRIEITSDGITTRMNHIDSYIHWQDIRLFARYRSLKLFNNNTSKPYTYTYELAGTDVVVRISVSPKSSLAGRKVEPVMTYEELEHWHEQLYGYIVQRTNLPLLDLELDAEDRQPHDSASSSSS